MSSQIIKLNISDDKLNIRIIFLGTAGAIPTHKRGLSSIAITRNGEIFVFDVGEGMQSNFLKSGLGVNRRMKIFITHLHADHCVGILGLLQTLSLQGRNQPLDVYGIPRLGEFIKENFRILNLRLSYDVNIHIITNDGIIVDEKDYIIECAKAFHSVESFSYRLIEKDKPGRFNVDKVKELGVPEGNIYKTLQMGNDIQINGKIIKSCEIIGPKRQGIRIGISGDTRPTEQLKKFFNQCDVLIFESTFSKKLIEKAIESYHTTAEEAATLGRECSVKELILTHFSARYDDTTILLQEAKAIYPNVHLAEDLKVFEL